MAGWSGLSNGAKALAGGGAAAVLAVVAYLLFGTPLDTGNSQVDPQASDTITQPASQTSPTHETTQGASDTAEADTAGITGKDVTPFLLQRIFELTEGRSLAANIALVCNNARLAAGIATHITAATRGAAMKTKKRTNHMLRRAQEKA